MKTSPFLLGASLVLCIAQAAIAAPDPHWAASLPPVITPELRSRLATEDYSRQEQRNIQTGLRILQGGKAGVDAQRVAARAVTHRQGLAALAALAGSGKGDSATAFSDRRDVAEDIVASENRLWILSRFQGRVAAALTGGKVGQAVDSHETTLYSFDSRGRITDRTIRADELDVARQAGVPVTISASTAQAYPIPKLAYAANNSPAPPKLSDAEKASLLDDSWPPLWPAIVSDPALQRRIAQGAYTAEERRNIKIALIYISRDRSVPINAEGSGVRRTGMEDLARVTGMKAGLGGGYKPTSMPDRQQQLEDIFAKGDQVWVSWRWFGTHQGEWYGAPGNGRPVLAHESGVFTIRDGKVTGAEMRCDELEMAQQIGIPITLNASN